jgi:hypothetical protein
MLALFARRYPSAIGNNEGVMIVATSLTAATSSTVLKEFCR